MDKIILHSFRKAFQVLSTGISIDDTILNEALYELICFNDNNTVSEKILNYYGELGIDNVSKTQFKIKHKNAFILDAFKKNNEEYPLNSEITSGDEKIMHVFKKKNIRFAKKCFDSLLLHYKQLDRDVFEKKVIQGFKFNVYRDIYSISCIEDLCSINDKSTKILLLKWMLYKYMNEIFSQIYYKLDEYGIIKINTYHISMNLFDDSKDVVVYIKSPKELNKQITKLTTICLSKNNIKRNITEEADIREKLKECCRYKVEENLARLIDILNNLRKDFMIYPNGCNKKMFSEIVYILYNCQHHIGMKVNHIKTYKKFMKLMCLYYEYPETTYKINDIHDSAIKLMKSRYVFNDFKFDGR